MRGKNDGHTRRLRCGCLIHGGSVPLLCDEGERLANDMRAAYDAAAGSHGAPHGALWAAHGVADAAYRRHINAAS